MLLLTLIGPATAADPAEADEAPGAEVVVAEDRARGSASGRDLDRAALDALPGRSADDVLRAMPGLHQSAHGGHGKAYQYFLRGFDAVHGADLAVHLQGVPVNELSNVHAHGYLDLHFIPRALISRVELWPGAWRADVGDFAVAGSAALTLGLDSEGGQAWIGGGSDRSGEASVAWRPQGAPAGSFLIAEASLGQGVGEARGWRQLRAGAGVEGSLSGVMERAWILAYDGVFESPGVLRVDDLEAGDVGFYDAYPGSGGGRSSRALAGGELKGGGGQRAWQATAWAGWRALSLQQNFTGWYEDLEHGDGSEQVYSAGSFGARGRAAWAPSSRLVWQGGLDARVDRVSQEEHAVDVAGVRWDDVASLEATQAELAAWTSAPSQPLPWLRVEPGLRAELFLVQGEALAWAPALAPKLSVSAFDEAALSAFLSLGRGLRSPDARAAGAGRAPVATVNSGELGLTWDPRPWFGARAAGFLTLVSDEIVFDHVQARYLPSGATRRTGVDLGAALRPLEGLRLQADLTASDGRYAGSGAPIPYAPRLLLNAGLYAERISLGPTTLTAGLRTWALGARPLPGGFTSQRAAVVDLTSTLAWGPWRLSLDVDNLLGAQWRDGEFTFPSRWDPAAPKAELPVRHFTAGAPRVARLDLGVSF